MRIKYISLLLTFISVIANANPQVTMPRDSMEWASADTTETTRKHPWLAGMEIAGFNATLVGFNRIFKKDESFSHVTMRDIRRNITHRHWFWDMDGIEVNGFRHPIHGSLFYLMARANGMSGGESSLYTLGGSWMWEIFCEAEDPSINDMVYTTVGGITIGETLWRSGKCLYDLITKGRKKEMSTHFSTSLTIGYQNFVSHNDPSVKTVFVSWDATYGDLFNDERRGLFDYFNANTTFVFGSGQRIFNKARIDHQLWSRSLINKPTKKVMAGLYNHYDYLCVTPYDDLPREESDRHPYTYSEVGAIGPGLSYRIGQHTYWEQQLYVNGIMLGATTEYKYHSWSRGYSFGSGYGARLYTKLSVGTWLRVGVRAQFSHLFTWDGYYEDEKKKVWDGSTSIQGETGNALTTLIVPTFELKTYNNIALQFSGLFTHTHFNYTYHPHTSTHAWEWQVGVRYKY